jgi:hypothetical protein
MPLRHSKKPCSCVPNYAIARFNLAEAIADTNPKRAITEYETYLALTSKESPKRQIGALSHKTECKALKHQ